MQNGLIFLVNSLLELYLITFVIRLGLQWARSDVRNPLVQFFVTVTNPLVVPLQKVIPPLGRLDLATLLVFFILQWATIAVIGLLSGLPLSNPLFMLTTTLVAGLRTIVGVYMVVIIIFVVMSWISMGGGYNPSLQMVNTILRDLAEPVLLPFRRIIPAIAGIDLSPLVAILILQTILVMLS